MMADRKPLMKKRAMSDALSRTVLRFSRSGQTNCVQKLAVVGDVQLLSPMADGGRAAAKRGAWLPWPAQHRLRRRARDSAVGLGDMAL